MQLAIRCSAIGPLELYNVIFLFINLTNRLRSVRLHIQVDEGIGAGAVAGSRNSSFFRSLPTDGLRKIKPPHNGVIFYNL